MCKALDVKALDLVKAVVPMEEVVGVKAYVTSITQSSGHSSLE